MSNRATPSSPRHAFSEIAVVLDEGRTHQGHDAIETWLVEAQRSYAYHVEPLTVVRDEADIIVVARYAGDFPSSPADLNHLFRFTDHRIEFLEIH